MGVRNKKIYLKNLHTKTKTDSKQIFYGNSALTTLCSVSPILFLFVPLLKLNVMGKVYDFFALHFSDGFYFSIC